MAFARALVGLDLSPASDLVVDGLHLLAGLGLRKLVLLHVVPVTLFDHPAAGVPVDKLVGEAARQARERLERYRVRLEGEGFEVDVLEPPVGEPSVAIVRTAERLGVDLVVLGGKGRSWLREILLGSTVEEVLRLARLPVLVYKPLDGPVEERPVTVGVDVESVDPALVGCLERLAGTGVREVHLVYVEEGGVGARRALEKLEALAARVAGGLRVHATYVPHGSPARGVLEVAERLGSRLVVVSRRGRGSRVRDVLLGTTADAVVRHSRVPVLVCRGQ